MNRPLLYIASDLFFADWGSVARGGLWLSFRPHVVVSDGSDPAVFEGHFKGWINAGHCGQNVDYKMVSHGDVPNDLRARFQPVTFPSNVDIKIAVQYGVGGTWTEIGVVQRSQRLAVLDPAELKKKNTPIVTGAGENSIEDQSPPSSPEKDRPFAYGYIASLQKALEDKAPLAILADEMMRAQELGRTFLADDHMIVGISTDTAIIPVPSPGEGMIAASLHSLLGHTLCLGKRSDLAKLRTITDVMITLDYPGKKTEKEGLFVLSELIAPGQSTVASFFSALEPQFDGKVELDWMKVDLSRRIYVNDALTTFPYRAASNWFVRRREGALGLPEEDLSLVDIRRLRVDVRLPDKLEAGTQTSPLSRTLSELEFQPFVALHCRLRLYRGFPKRGGPGGAALMRLVPHIEDRADFLAELNRLTHDLDWAEQQTRLRQFFANNVLWEDENEGELNPKPEFVFWGMLPWDQIDSDELQLPTLLFFGKLNTGSDSNGNAVTLLVGRSTRLIARQRPNDPLYWETRYPSSPVDPNNKEEFHRLLLITDVPEDDRKFLVLSTGLAGDVTFHLAQSSSRVEAVAKVTYPFLDGEEITPSAEFQDDLISFVNLRLTGCVPGATPEDLTGRGNLYPVYQEESKDSGRRLHTYHFSTAATAMPTNEDKELVLGAIPSHFKSFYDRASSLPTAYKISPRLAHVLGPELVGQDDVSGAKDVILPNLDVARPLDVPVSMASTVRTKVGQGDDRVLFKFLTVKFSSPKSPPYAEDEVATLIFQQRFLKASNVTNNDLQVLYVEAWNAVAELCVADKIFLDPYLVRFDFRAGCKEGKFRLGDALKPVEAKFRKDIKKDVQDALSKLYTETIDEKDLKIEIVLSRSSDANRIYRLSNAVEFRLTIERSQDKAPNGDPSSWTLTRLVTTTAEGEPLPVDELYDNEHGHGRKVKDIDENDPDNTRIKKGFKTWLRNLRTRSDGIDADASEVHETQVFRSFVGGGAASRVDSAIQEPNIVDTIVDPDDWIVPEGPIDPAPGSAEITLLPIGFRPIKFYPLFGAKTDTMYRRYLQWIESLINCSNTKLADTNTANEWSQYFKALYDYGHHASGYKTFMENLAALAWPMHEPGAKNPQGQEIFPPAINDLASATAEKDGIVRAKVVARIAADIKRDPSVFFDTKAYLYTRLTGDAAANHVLPTSFFRMSAFRKIAGKDSPTAAAEDRITLSVPESFSPDDAHFGFLEPLSDRRYDYDFTVQVPELQTFEAIIDRSVNKSDSRYSKDTTTLAIPVAQCTIPNGVIGGDTTPSIFLASRKRVEMPQLLAAIPLNDNDVSRWANIDRTKAIALTALKRGRLEDQEQDEDNSYRWIGSSLPITLSSRLDDPVVALIMAIEGDEETFIESLDSDILRIKVDPIDPGKQSQNPNLHLIQESEAEFAKRLSNTVDFNGITEKFDLAIAPGIFEKITESVEPAQVQPPDGSNTWLDLTFDSKPKDGEITIKILPNDGWVHKYGGVAAHLLRNTRDEARAFILIILAELPVWDSYQIEAQQIRNSMRSGSVGVEPGRIFAPEFGMISERVSNKDPLSIETVVNVYQNTQIELEAGPLTVAELVSKLLLTVHDFTNDSGLKGRRAILTNDSPWPLHDLSITISHEQRVVTPQAYFNDDGSAVTSVDVPLPANCPLFPLKNVRVDKGQSVDQPFNWFEQGVVDYQVEFHWSSTTNLRFFSVKGVRCLLVT